jgi:hypothetical protein
MPQLQAAAWGQAGELQVCCGGLRAAACHAVVCCSPVWGQSSLWRGPAYWWGWVGSESDEAQWCRYLRAHEGSS